MSKPSVMPFPEKVNTPMPDTSPLYRIRHLDHDWYWKNAIWGLKADARIYTQWERNDMEVLPDRGLWEVVAKTQPITLTVRPPLDRAIVAQTITSYLWTQHCHEEGLTVVPRLQDVSPAESKPFIVAGEFITNLTLSPDRFEAALMAAADVICANGASPDHALTIFDASTRMQQHYYALAVSALHALQENVKEVPPDWHYRDQLCRLIDGIVPKSTAVIS